MTERGKFIVLEGIDGSSKATQFKLLEQRLKSLKKKLITADFPRYYESKWGQLVGRFLTGEFGKLDEVSPYLAVLPYMIDEYTWSRDIGAPWLKKGGWVLSNRYFTSNVHQIAKLNTASQKKYRDWLWPAGYEELGLLKPNLVIFIDTMPEISRKLNLRKGNRAYTKRKKRDIAENHWEHQKAAYREYKKAVKAFSWWVAVEGVKTAKGDYSQQIHQEIWKAVEKRLL